KMGFEVTIVTRDEVLKQHEDVLEIREISAVSSALAKCGVHVTVVPVSGIDAVARGKKVLLLNVDYRGATASALLRRHRDREIDCFPNPYFQMACQRESGLPESEMGLGHKHRKT